MVKLGHIEHVEKKMNVEDEILWYRFKEPREKDLEVVSSSLKFTGLTHLA